VVAAVKEPKPDSQICLAVIAMIRLACSPLVGGRPMMVWIGPDVAGLAEALLRPLP